MAEERGKTGEAKGGRYINGELLRPADRRKAESQDAPPTPAETAPADEKVRGVSIGVALSLGFGGLVALAVGAVLYLALASGRDASVAVLGDRAATILDMIEERVDRHLAPAAEQSEVLADNLSTGELGFEDILRLSDFMAAMMSGSPQVGGMMVVGPNLESLRVARVDGKFEVEIGNFPENSPMAGAVADAALRGEGYWGQIAWAPLPGKTVINYRQSVPVDGAARYTVFSAITVDDLSSFLADPAANSGNIFVLYGDDRVLAHPALIDGAIELNADKPLPAIAEVGDPILNASWLGDGQRGPLPANADWSNLQGHTVSVGDGRHVVLYRDVSGYGPVPWRIGTAFPIAALAGDLQRLLNAAAAGVMVLLIAVILAILLGRYIARPVRDLADAARTVGNLDLDHAPNVNAGGFRETRDAADAFNAMLAGLKSFGIYVPRSLVHRLMRQGDIGALKSETREVTVLFTDIVSFTALAEGRDAAEIAEFLNGHFTLLTGEIEATGGTVDKYIGDSVMAFWGAPDRQPDHAERGARCAARIAEILDRDNAARRKLGLAPVRVRIGIHSGPAIVGNVGGPTRVDYTLVGDTVNIASRLNDMAREYLGSDSSAVALVSGETADALPNDFPVSEMGETALRGRSGKVRIRILDLSKIKARAGA